MDNLFAGILGFLFGLFSKFIYDWNIDIRERRTLRRSLLLEILYMHEPTQRLLLDKYHDPYKEGHFLPEDLGRTFWRPVFSITIYQNHVNKIDRLLASDVSLQLHYYYSLVKKLNDRMSKPDDKVDEDFAKEYLDIVAHAYAIGNGAVEAILGSLEARKEMQENLRLLLENFDDIQQRKYVAELLRNYKLKGAAKSIESSPPKRWTELLRRKWF